MMSDFIAADPNQSSRPEKRLTVVIPHFNQKDFLPRAVASSLQGETGEIEIIIVDDGSTDDSAVVADELAQQNVQEIRVIHQSNTGPGPAREAGRRASSGEFIQYLDSDDVLLPRKFELQVAGLRDHPERDVAYGKTRFRRLNQPPQDVPWKRTGEHIDKMFPSFLRSRWWGTSTPLYRRRVTDRAGSWIALLSEEDWEYDCRIAAAGARLHYVPEFVSEQRDHSGERLTGAGTSGEVKLRSRAVAHKLVLSHAKRAGITEEYPEMKHFARELFLLSRQCGAAGLEEESQGLFALAREASGEARGNGWDFRLYGFLASLVGWRRLGKMACYSDVMRFDR